jgi:methionyl-tRNA formyltransferase
MPTGYTYVIAEDNCSFNEYVWRCIEAFLPERREDNTGRIPLTVEPRTWHLEQLEQEKAELIRLRGLSDAECEAEANKEYATRIAARIDSLEDKIDVKSRYEAMLEQVKAWNPPDEIYTEFKKFMIEQIEQSISYDCSSHKYVLPPVTKQTGEQWRQEQIDISLKNIQYEAEYYQKDLDRTAHRNEFVQKLHASVPMP